MDILIKLLNTKDAERLEWTLVCLAFLFKVLKPYLKKDIAVVLKRIIPLLSESQPQYINNFAAESFAFVARDIRDKKKFLSLILNYLQTNDDVSICKIFETSVLSPFEVLFLHSIPVSFQFKHFYKLFYYVFSFLGNHWLWSFNI